MENDANAMFVPSMMQMVISEKAENEYAALLHELGEFGLAYNRQEMKELQETFVRYWAEKNGIKGIDDLGEIVRRYQRRYAEVEGSKTVEQAMDEIVNDALAGLFSSDEGVDQFTQWLQSESGYSKNEQKTIVQRLLDMIDNIVKYLKNLIKDSNVTTVAKKAAELETERTQELRKKFLEVLEGAIENANTIGEHASEVETKFQLKGIDENGIEVYETSDKTKKMKYSERKALLLNLMKNEFAGRTAKFEKKGQVYYALYDEAGVRKGVYGDKKSDKKGFNAKVNIGADGNYIELAENAKYDGTSSEQGKKNKFHRDAKEWDYYVKTIKSDGIYFDVVINVKDNGNEQYVYDVQLNEKEVALSHALKHLKSKEAISNSIVSKDSKNASEIRKFSLAGVDALTADNDARIKAYDLEQKGKSELSYSLNVDIDEEISYFGVENKLNDYVGVQKAVLEKLDAEKFYRDVVNKETGITISIGRKGIKETLGSGKRFQALPRDVKKLKIATLHSLPDLIEKSVLTKDNAANIHNKSAFFSYFETDVKINDKDYTITFDVKKTSAKNHFWIHCIRINKKDSALLTSALERQKIHETQNPSEEKITDSTEEVKKNSLPEEYEELRRQNENTLRENDIYRHMIDYMERRMESVKGTKISEKNIEKVADKMHRRYKSTASKELFRKNVAELFELMSNGNGKTEDFVYLAEEVLRPVLEQSKDNKQISDYAKDILKNLKSTTVKLDAMQKKEVSYHYTTYNDYRRSLFGRMNFSDKGLNDTPFLTYHSSKNVFHDTSIK